MESSTVNWRKSSRCASNACVEVAKVDGGIMVRDSKNPERTPLVFTPEEWSAFVEGVNQGEFSF
ncbi:hypothetical protein GCM10010172_00610 [Paractinoplanes ferrugineus]|uniref:DUF397 domain-containing protein n=1 Tax=Paractinoplanes ferrugineus TaxID=113564 RepID=A0A919MFL3_9ACTN|nr:DUF397 domain-containing protein [Actinoplanes ferrugineus]GIE13908.1 hypothetical protein Afe05nite_57480 [Actinoplanes ferrugineus]